MFSKFFQKATLIGIAAITGFTMTGTLMANPAQAETSAFIRRASIRKKPTKNYRITSPKPTNSNKPASVSNSVSEKTNNNNQPTSSKNSSTIRK
ncbi:MAG: hypothetical protein AAFQ91_17235 [Cyanobacteria bacterium J06621_15]